MNGLDPMAYLVSASVPAYTAAPRDPEAQPTYYRVGDSVKLELIKGGVITGSVTTSTGEPVVAVHVHAYMIRDAKGQSPRYDFSIRERSTDDRGIYRIYGLASGTYIVSAGGASAYFNSIVNAYDSDSPTYAPSSTRDTATQINVRSGEETTNVDIRYRGEPGHAVSGIARGPQVTASSGLNILLTSIVNGVSQSSISSFQPAESGGFAFNGIADGIYVLTAQSFLPGHVAASEPKRIQVKGADITDVELIANPLGSIAGRVALAESKIPDCNSKRRPLFGETVISAWHDEKTAAKDQPQFLWNLGAPSTPDPKGEFTLRNLAPGQYRFNARFFAKYWYLKSISLASSSTANVIAADKLVDAARSWTSLKQGGHVSGLTITLAEGAASFHGQVKVPEGQKLPPRLFVYLVPAEPENAQDILRYHGALIDAGTFALNNLAPGRYWAIAKPAGQNEANVLSLLRLPDETEFRAKLRHEAEAAKIQTELKPCQNVIDYQLPFEPSANISSVGP